ncbi:hypothetical protein [Streptomyces sp. NPDC051546]|uniref:hypothetical protein n=1 Tax=Streptomyces sp. NPDC051546 TaxID=3365655 RepID=UPI0037BD534A
MVALGHHGNNSVDGYEPEGFLHVWAGADTITPYEADTRLYLEHIPTASGRSIGAAVVHEDFFAPEPADPTAKVRAGEEAAAFFLEQLV